MYKATANQDLKIREDVGVPLGKEERYTIKNQLVINNQGYIIHKTANHNKGKRHIGMMFINRIHPIMPKDVVNVYDLGYLEVEKDFPEQLSALQTRKKRNLELSEKE